MTHRLPSTAATCTSVSSRCVVDEMINDCLQKYKNQQKCIPRGMPERATILEETFNKLLKFLSKQFERVRLGYGDKTVHNAEGNWFASSCVTQNDVMISEEISRVHVTKLSSVAQERQLRESIFAPKFDQASGDAGRMQTSVDVAAIAHVQQLNKMQKEVEASYQNLETCQDKSVKKFKLQLAKSIITPINQIHTVHTNGMELRDRIQKIISLLSGKDRSINVTTIPSAIPYLKDRIARKLVEQAHKQIESNHESAFPFAAIVIELWTTFPDVGDLILVHLYNACPYLIPDLPVKSEGQTTQDYFRSLGYQHDDNGVVEKQDYYLKRLSGLMWFYAAIIQSPAATNTSHPHGLEHGWAWLSRILNLHPRSDHAASAISTLLYDFLQVTGHALYAAYGKQFDKVLYMICTEYVPKLKALDNLGAPISRLQVFLESCIRQRGIPKAKGVLADRIWLEIRSTKGFL